MVTALAWQRVDFAIASITGLVVGKRTGYKFRSMSTPPSMTTAMILAAGQGTRMKSKLPKVLHPCCGRPVLHYPVRAALDAGANEVVVVVGHGREQVGEYLAHAFGERVHTAIQLNQAGTGDAAKAGMLAVSPAAARVLIYYGDVPLLEAQDIAGLLAAADASPDYALVMASCVVSEPFGYGRVIRNPAGEVLEIREHKDLRTDDERSICEINPGIYIASVVFMQAALASLAPNNAQKEYYLTDIVAYAVAQGKRVKAISVRAEVMEGVNDRAQLYAAEQAMNARLIIKLRKSGVTIRHNVSIDDSVQIAPDSTIESNVVLRGSTSIGAGAVVDVGCVLTDVQVADFARLRSYTVAESSRIGVRAQVGPFSHLRAGSDLGEESHVGNFVETKKTKLAKGAKANHLSYLGDGIIGERVNIGAGTIFCNYDGFNKHTTVLEDDVFVGCDSHLVAPITVGKGAYIATGTTVTQNVPPAALAIGRVKQANKDGYATRLRGRLSAEKAASDNKKP